MLNFVQNQFPNPGRTMRRWWRPFVAHYTQRSYHGDDDERIIWPESGKSSSDGQRRRKETGASFTRSASVTTWMRFLRASTVTGGGGLKLWWVGWVPPGIVYVFACWMTAASPCLLHGWQWRNFGILQVQSIICKRLNYSPWRRKTPEDDNLCVRFISSVRRFSTWNSCTLCSSSSLGDMLYVWVRWSSQSSAVPVTQSAAWCSLDGENFPGLKWPKKGNKYPSLITVWISPLFLLLRRGSSSS